MTIEEIKAWLGANKEEKDVIAFVAEITPEAKITAEAVQPFLETPEGKELLQPITDRAVSGAIKTYKEGHFDSEVKAEVAKEVLRLNPAETPESKEIRELREKFDKSEEGRKKDKLQRMIVERAAEQKVDSWWVDDFSGNTIEEAEVFLGKIKTHDAAIEERTRNELLAAGFKPGGSGTGDKNKVDLSKLSQADAIKMEEAGELDAAMVG